MNAIVLRLARQVRLLDEETGRLLDGGASGAVPTLSLAVNADSLATWFLDALVEVRREVEVVFDLHREDQDRTAALLRDGTVAAAVTAESRPVQGCSSAPLGVDRYLGLLPESQAVAGLGSGRLVELTPGRHADVTLWWQRWNLRSPLLDTVSRCVERIAGERLHPVRRA